MTGYVVHYSDGVDKINQTVAASSTSSNITNLDRNTPYQFSVEATSEHLSGESNNCTISLFGQVSIHSTTAATFTSKSHYFTFFFAFAANAVVMS